MRLRFTAGLLMLAAISAQPAFAAVVPSQAAAQLGAQLLRLADAQMQRGEAVGSSAQRQVLPPLMNLLLASLDANEVPVIKPPVGSPLALSIEQDHLQWAVCIGEPNTRAP